jgi:hypothetical protein
MPNIQYPTRNIQSTSEAPRGKPRGIFAKPCEAKIAISPRGKPRGFRAKQGESTELAQMVFSLLHDWILSVGYWIFSLPPIRRRKRSNK